MTELLSLLSAALIIAGCGCCLIGAVGLFRFPDFYTRMHAAGVTDTLGCGLLVLGLILQPGIHWLVIAKLCFILVFIPLTSPTAAHALAKAARKGGLAPLLGPQGSPKEAQASQGQKEIKQ
ncbi:monovalent cation/H(+) antiporter subunit G [Ferrimonas marina]|nr:monovalent cation/H(+) antiporter subunit G [Ferrimonas marina]